MNEEIITRDSQEYKDLHRNLVKAIQSIDILIDTHRPAIGNEVYLTSEEICSIFSISKRSLQNYRDNRQIPYTTIGVKFSTLNPLSTNSWTNTMFICCDNITGWRLFLQPVLLFIFNKVATIYNTYPIVGCSEVYFDRIPVQRQEIFPAE